MNMEFNQHIIEYMTHCYSRQLRPKTMHSYESTLRLFERWCKEELGIETVDAVTESTIRHYISDIQQRGKYTFYSNDLTKVTNAPEHRRDYCEAVSTITINNYLRNLRAFFNWLEYECIIKQNPMQRIKLLKSERKAKEYMDDTDFRKLTRPWPLCGIPVLPSGPSPAIPHLLFPANRTLSAAARQRRSP